MYSYVVIDDDDFARETLEELLSEIPRLSQLKSLGDSGMAIKYLATLQPDIVFLDVNMPKKSGMDVQKEILDLGLKSKVIFTTAHEEYVLEAFKNKAFDYLVKPVRKNELHETLDRLFEEGRGEAENSPLQEKQTKGKKNEIVIKNAFGALILQCDDIFYVEADGTYSNIYLVQGKKEVVSRNIGKIEGLFPKETFFKVSRSHIINLNYLMKTDRLNKKITLMVEGQSIQLKVSRERFYDLEQRMGAERGTG